MAPIPSRKVFRESASWRSLKQDYIKELPCSPGERQSFSFRDLLFLLFLVELMVIISLFYILVSFTHTATTSGPEISCVCLVNKSCPTLL